MISQIKTMSQSFNLLQSDQPIVDFPCVCKGCRAAARPHDMSYLGLFSHASANWNKQFVSLVLSSPMANADNNHSPHFNL